MTKVQWKHPDFPDIYYFVADNTTVDAVNLLIQTSCSTNNDAVGVPFDPTLPSELHPELVVQWYRASSAALFLDGYNNTIATSYNAPATNQSALMSVALQTPLPSTINEGFLKCLNDTVIETIPIYSSGYARLSSEPSPCLLLVMLAFLLPYVLKYI